MRQLCYVDLVVYHERGAGPGDLLFKKHAHSLLYLQHLPDGYNRVAFHGADFNETFIRNNVQLVFFNGSNNFWAVPFGLFAKIGSLKPDIVMFHGFKFAWQLLWLKRFLPRTTRILVRNHAEQPFPGLKSIFQRWASAFVDIFFFVSQEQAESWTQRRIITPRHRLFEVMEGSNSFTLKDSSECRERLRLPAGPLFLWVGRLDSNKDPLTILKAFERFKASGHPFTLLMAFSSNALEPEVAGFIRKHNMGDQVKLIGAVEHDQMETWYNSADYFVLGSHHEGSGFALCEAMACGCVPIVTNIPSFKKMTDDGQLGFSFEPGNSGQLLKALTQTVGLNTRPLRVQVRNFFEQELSHQAIARKINLACQQVLACRCQA